MWAMTNGYGFTYVVGFSDDSCFGPHLGGADAIVMGAQIPEPATLATLVLGGLAMVRRPRKDELAVCHSKQGVTQRRPISR